MTEIPLCSLRQPPTLLTLPPELREHIYRLILHPAANRRSDDEGHLHYIFAPALVLLKINRQIYLEAVKVFRDLNHFVLISTPWPEAQSHVHIEGNVPILACKEQAARFTAYSMEVKIDAPEQSHFSPNWPPSHFVVHAADIESFTRMWFYADLSHPGLNQYLRLTLRLQDPFTPAYEAKHLPKSVQRTLLLPFGEVKDLDSVRITGDPAPYPSLEKELAAAMRTPHPSPERCLAECTRLKDLGNAALADSHYAAALTLYEQAWLAMHVVIRGRARHIHGDAFFARELAAPFVGQRGDVVRLVLRCRLVANTALVYLKLEQWDEVIFWGMRTIGMLREAMGLDARAEMLPQNEAVLGFPAAAEMGKIYYRTAVAYGQKGERVMAGKLLLVAQVYLPMDQSVRRDVASTSLRLG